MSELFDTHETTPITRTLARLLQVLVLNVSPLVGQLVPGLARVELFAVLLVNRL